LKGKYLLLEGIIQKPNSIPLRKYPLVLFGDHLHSIYLEDQQAVKVLAVFQMGRIVAGPMTKVFSLTENRQTTYF